MPFRLTQKQRDALYDTVEHKRPAPKTKAQKQAESPAALIRQREQQEAEYYRQRTLPTLEDKVAACGEAISALAALVGGVDAELIGIELGRILAQETQI